MRLRYQRSQIHSRLTILILSLYIFLQPDPGIGQEQSSPLQPYYGTLETDGWVIELFDKTTGSSIYVPFNSMADEQTLDFFEIISEVEKKPVEFFSLQPEVQAYLFESNSLDRYGNVEADELIVPLTPCPEGYCLPPWSFNFSERQAEFDLEGAEWSVPVVSSNNIGRFLEPIE